MRVNTTKVIFLNNTIKKKRLKAINTQLYCIRDCTCQGQFNIYWSPISTNPGNYHTKHHATVHHRLMHPNFLHDEPHVNLANLMVMYLLWGCVNPCRLSAVCTYPVLDSRRNIMSTNSHHSIFGASHTHKLMNNVFLTITIVNICYQLGSHRNNFGCNNICLNNISHNKTNLIHVVTLNT